MIKKIYITVFFLTQFCISQNMNTNCIKSEKINPENVINSYIHAIGGQKKINKIKTIKKNIETIITNSSHVKMNTVLLFKKPNLYSYALSIPHLGEVQSTKYDGINCIIKQNINNKKIEKKIEGKLLEKKKKEFYPFPILEIECTKQKVKIVNYNNSSNDSNYNIIELIDLGDKKIQYFFDCESNLLVMKKIFEQNKTSTIKYDNYRDIEGVLFPFYETNTIEIDNKIVQENKNTILEIILNEDINLIEFQ